MRIGTHLTTASEPAISLEYFTPKSDRGHEQLLEAMGELAAAAPAFVSVTCGAAGSTRARTATTAIALQRQFGVPTMAHMVCTGTTLADIDESLMELTSSGVSNVLALRGDPPRGESAWAPIEGGLRHANELIAYIRPRFDVSIGGACYPETHHEAADGATDIANLKRKVDAGAEFLITQVFFDNHAYWNFVATARAEGIQVPIIPGVMPLVSLANLERIATLSPSTGVPPELRARLAAASTDDEAIHAGARFAAAQCAELLDGGAPGVHFYTLNRATPTMLTINNLRELRATPRTSKSEAL